MKFTGLRLAAANGLLLLLSVLVCPSSGLRRVVKNQADWITRAQWSALLQVEAEDSQFWAAEWADLESELLQLVQVGNATNATHQAKLSESHGTGAKPHMNAASSKAGTRHKSPLAGVKVNLNPKSVADLVPALAMLKGLYEDGKDRIAHLNSREKQSKIHFDAKKADHDARIASIEAHFKNHTLSLEYRTTETRDENRMFNYWQRVRERQHRQFHTSLKIQHATMEKEKMMIDAYEKTIAGTASKAQVTKEIAKVAGGVVPEVVFLQVAWRKAVPFFREALAEVRAAKDEFHTDAPLV